MSRGFVSKANKQKAAHLEVLRRGYLSAIAWRNAAWLATLHVERERARDIVRHLMPANRDQAQAEDAAEHERVQSEAYLALLDWPGAVVSSGPRPWERAGLSRSDWRDAEVAKNAARPR